MNFYCLLSAKLCIKLKPLPDYCFTTKNKSVPSIEMHYVSRKKVKQHYCILSVYSHNIVSLPIVYVHSYVMVT